MRIKWLTACALWLLLSPLTGVVDSAAAAQDRREWTTVELADAGISIDYPTGWTEVVPAARLGPVELPAYLRGDGHEAAEYWGIDPTGSADQVYAEWNSHAQDYALKVVDLGGGGSELIVTVVPFRWDESAGLTGWWKNLDEFKRTTLAPGLTGGKGKIVSAAATRVGGRPAFFRIQRFPGGKFSDGSHYPAMIDGYMEILGVDGRIVRIHVVPYMDHDQQTTRAILRSVTALG